jgi:hypothetical protein
VTPTLEGLTFVSLTTITYSINADISCSSF